MSRGGAAARRHLAATGDQPLPVCPGVIPDDTPAWREYALAAAHEVLPYIAGTRVQITVFGFDDGLEELARRGWDRRRLDQLRHHPHATAGPDPHVVVCARMPKETT